MQMSAQNQTPFRLPLKKRIFLHPLVQAAACWLVAQFIRFIWLTCRVQRHIHPAVGPYMHGQDNAIFCFWHGRMLIFPCIKPARRAMYVLISHHRDGELIAKVVRHFAIDAVRGSSSRGAREALRSMMKLLEGGGNISITPDGPRGPAFKAQEGASALARLSGKALVPVSFSATHGWQLSSWDRFLIPKPFSKILVIAGEPLLPEQSAGLEASLLAITQWADAECGRADATSC